MSKKKQSPVEETPEETQTKLSPDEVKAITDFIKERKEAGIESTKIRIEVFKKFKIDTTQWELNWEPKAAKGKTHSGPVESDKQLITTHDITRRNEPVTFKYMFTESEINERANTLAQLEIDRSELEDQKKNVVSDFKTKIEEKENSIGKVAREINSGYEMRNETCEVLRDFGTGTKKAIYRGDVVKEERMTAADYTLQFPE